MANKTLIFSFLFIFCFSIASATTISYTNRTTTECSFGVCTKTLYSGIQNVIEDNEWKDIDKVISLKDTGIYNVIVLENDKDYPLEVLDYNMTSVTVDLGHWSILNDDVDLKVWRVNATKKMDYVDSLIATSTEKEPDKSIEIVDKVTLKEYYKEVYDEIVKTKVPFNLFDMGSKVEIFNARPGDIIEFGPNSTTIVLQTRDTENLEDSWVNEGNPTYVYGSDQGNRIGQYEDKARGPLLTKWKISSLNSSVNIINANMTLDIWINDIGSTTTYDFGAHHLYPTFDWTEHTIYWNNKPTAGDFNSSYDSIITVAGTDTGVSVFNITNMMNTAVANNNANLTVYLIVTDGVNIGSNSQMLYSSKEDGTAAERPKVEVTYTTDTCSYSSGTWEVNCADNCSITEAVDLGGSDISIIGSGIFTITGANITNFGTGLVAGTNASSQCVVRCRDGGCLNF